MATRITNKDKFTAIRAILETSTDARIAEMELLAFIDERLEQLDRKRSSSKPTQTKTQKENILLKDAILEVLSACTEPVTIADLLTAESLAEVRTPQKASALLSQMVNEGTVVKTYEKKKAFFSIA